MVFAMTPATASDTAVTDTPDSRPRLGWAYFGSGLGAVVSVAANVAASYIPPTDAGDNWQPYTGAVIGAVFWPVALLVALEIIVRTDWPAGRRWVVIRFGGLVPVAVVAAVVSYRHMSRLLTHYGEDRLTATIGPLAVDGLMVMAAGAVIAVTRHRSAGVTPIAAVVPDTAGAGHTALSPAPAGTPVTPDSGAGTVTDIRRASRDTRPKRNGASGDKAAQARRLRDSEGLTAPQIAERMGVSERTAFRYLNASDSAASDTAEPADPEPAVATP